MVLYIYTDIYIYTYIIPNAKENVCGRTSGLYSRKIHKVIKKEDQKGVVGLSLSFPFTMCSVKKQEVQCKYSGSFEIL